ncbi:DNA repair protein REV1 [Aphelenchoides besseyi]|nr:DNA repair protein REV1 [Aphelenchoides besseyi]
MSPLDFAQFEFQNDLEQQPAEDELALEKDGDFRNFGHYMQAKVIKLRHQVHEDVLTKSELFDGISIYVNGWTIPTSLQLRRIITENGGRYHHYIQDETTYIIAAALSESRWKKIRANQMVVRPDWIVKWQVTLVVLSLIPFFSLKLKKLLSVDKFLLTRGNQTNQSGPSSETSLHSRLPFPEQRPSKVVLSTLLQPTRRSVEPNLEAEKQIETEVQIESEDSNLSTIQQPQPQTSLPQNRPSTSGQDGKLQNGIDDFYDRSRLLLLSTTKTVMKEFVVEMRKNVENHEFTSRHRLKQLRKSERLNLKSEPVICHLDMDCYFVSVALRTRPELRGKPVIITHAKSTDGRATSEIATCSYEARARGVDKSMWVAEARKLCPDLICLPYQFDEYRETSKLLYTIIGRYTLDIQAISLDEVLFDLAPLCNEYKIKDPLDVISLIRQEIFEETQCTASAGLGPNPVVARLATKKAKPNGQFHVREAMRNEFMMKQEVVDLPSIGHATLKTLKKKFGNVETCAQLQSISLGEFQKLFGPIHQLLRGIADSQLQLTDTAARSSVSCNINFGVRLQTEQDLDDFLRDISEQLAKKLTEAKLKGSTLSVKLLIRHPDAPIEPEKYGGHGKCNSYSKAKPMVRHTDDSEVIFKDAKQLVNGLKPTISDIRGISIQMTNFLSPSDLPTSRKRSSSEVVVSAKRRRSDEVCAREDGPNYVYQMFQSMSSIPKNKCICNGDHEMTIELKDTPTFPAISVLRCLFHKIVWEEDYEMLDSCFHKLISSIKQNDQSDLGWMNIMRYLHRDVNLLGMKLFKYAVLKHRFD